MLNTAPYDVRVIRDLKDLIQQSCTLFNSNNAFLVKKGENNYEGISYSRFKEEIDALGTALHQMGLKDGFIAVLGENRYEWCVSYLAAVNGTGVIVPIDKELSPSETQNLLSRSNAAAVIYSGKFSDKINQIRNSLPAVKYFIDMDLEEDTDDALSFRQLVCKGRALLASGNRSFLDSEINPEEMSILLFTSGTTDLAKGVMLSHRNICFDITAVCSTVRIDSSDSSLSILPLHHTYECTLGFLAMIYNGGTLAFNEGLKHIAKNLKEVRPTVLFSVPLLLENMYKKIWEQAGKKKLGKLKLRFALFLSALLYKVFHRDVRRKIFKPIHDSIGGRLRLILTGAAAIDPAVSRGFRKMGISVLQGYGLTECAPLAIGNTDSSFKDASIGLPLPGVEIKIDRPDENGIGELLVKGDNVMLGYFKNEQATQKVLKNGWLYTGDLGYVDKDGFYYITGRSKNVIVTKNGKNIFPEEVESYINKSPFIQESMVWGKFDEETGETYINAQIVPNFDAIRDKLKLPSPPSREDIMKIIGEVIKKVNGDMPLYKRVREFTIREQEFVKTTTKKIKRYIEQRKSS